MDRGIESGLRRAVMYSYWNHYCKLSLIFGDSHSKVIQNRLKVPYPSSLHPVHSRKRLQAVLAWLWPYLAVGDAPPWPPQPQPDR